MKSKALLFFYFLVILLVLCACVQAQPIATDSAKSDSDWHGYIGTGENYSFYYSDGRNRAWEEDIRFLADTYLTGHPALSDKECMVISYYGSYDEEITYTDEFYDAQLRQKFVQQINRLIPQIDQLTDTEVLFEIHRIVATLSECHSSVGQPLGDIFPIQLEAIYTEGCYAYYVKTVPADLSELLYARLVAINNIPVEEIVDRLAIYISHEYETFVVQKMTRGRYLSRKLALEIAGVMGADDKDAQLTFETQSGTVTCTMSVMTQEVYDQMELIDGSISQHDLPIYWYADEKVYWYEILGENTLYFRITSMSEDPNENWNKTFNEVGSILRTASTPMKLIIDLRNNSGGSSTVMENFVSIINQCPSNGVYVLINESTASAAVITAQLLSDAVHRCVLVGSPAAQSANMFSLISRASETLPNSGYPFSVSKKYVRAASNCKDPTLMPDIVIYQTWEDYKKGIDSILEYVLCLS